MAGTGKLLCNERKFDDRSDNLPINPLTLVEGRPSNNRPESLIRCGGPMLRG